MLIYVRTAVAPGDLASSEDPTGHSPVPGRTPYNLHPETLLLPETLKPRRWSGGNATTSEPRPLSKDRSCWLLSTTLVPTTFEPLSKSREANCWEPESDYLIDSPRVRRTTEQTWEKLRWRIYSECDISKERLHELFPWLLALDTVTDDQQSHFKERPLNLDPLIRGSVVDTCSWAWSPRGRNLLGQ